MRIARMRQNILMLAEAFDAWRVIPRLMLLAYGYLVFNLYIWYKNIPTYVQEKCDASVITALLASGMSRPEVKAFACTVVDVVGGPTTAQSTFVTTIIGLSTGIFGLYTTTGRRWDGWEPTHHQHHITHDNSPYGPHQPAPKTSIQIFGEGEGDTPVDSDSPRP